MLFNRTAELAIAERNHSPLLHVWRPSYHGIREKHRTIHLDIITRASEKRLNRVMNAARPYLEDGQVVLAITANLQQTCEHQWIDTHGGYQECCRCHEVRYRYDHPK